MSRQSGPSLPPAPAVDSPDQFRNVVLVGPSGTGKSGVLAQLTGVGLENTTHKTESKPTTGLVAYAIAHDDTVITVLDTPGQADFVGEVRAGLRAADAAVFVISAVDEIDGPTALLWQECEAVGMPRAIVITKLDLPNTDFDATVTACRRAFGVVQPVYRPDGDSIVDLLNNRDPDLVETAIEQSEDELLLDAYLAGDDLPLDELRADLRKAVASGRFFPVLPVSFTSGAGVPELCRLIVHAFPAPTARPAPKVFTPVGAPAKSPACDASAPLLAEVVSTVTDPFVGRRSLVRIFSGRIHADDTLHVSGHLGRFIGRDVPGHPEHEDDDRVGQLGLPYGDAVLPVGTAIAGSIVVIGKLTHAETSDTLSSKDQPLVIEPWTLPIPLLPTAIRAATKSDDDKLAGMLQRLSAEDVTVRIEQTRDHQTVVWTLGPAHAEAVLTKIAERDIAVEAEELRLDLRETFVRPTSAQGRHVKQSGGHGQYAVVELTIEPLDRGAGVEFVDKVGGGSVPRQFIPSVEKGVRAQLESGVLHGYPTVDVRVTLTDGKAHSVDSSDMAFQTAAGLALRNAASEQTIALLEPVDAVTVEIADDHLGAVLSDLSGRRAKVLGTEPAGEGRTRIDAEVPQGELSRYPIDLRAVSHGTGTFTREPSRYDYLPAALAKSL
ncbi:GTP-binding protein [Calidifontibacter indicus]|uniref:GTP-binding protein n=1 Tax=Calidifontibacter indicus TaxID=419650 RepID=UPI003D718F58